MDCLEVPLSELRSCFADGETRSIIPGVRKCESFKIALTLSSDVRRRVQLSLFSVKVVHKTASSALTAMKNANLPHRFTLRALLFRPPLVWRGHCAEEVCPLGSRRLYHSTA